MKPKIKRVPHNIVVDILCGWFTLKGTDDYQLNIAEQIAAYQYSSLDDLVSVIQPYSKNPSTFKKELEELKNSEEFKPYWDK